MILINRRNKKEESRGELRDNRTDAAHNVQRQFVGGSDQLIVSQSTEIDRQNIEFGKLCEE